MLTQRVIARKFFPPRAVPDAGPIPDIHHGVAYTERVEIPEWVLECVRWRLEFRPNPGAGDVEAFVHEYTRPSLEYVTEDGEPVADVLQAADEPLTQAEICEQTHFAQGTISMALGDLDEKGLVETVDGLALTGDHAGRPPQYYRLAAED